MVGARGCPYDGSFCGAAVSASLDISLRVRKPDSILREMHELRVRYGVTAIRFVDDLFLGARRVIDSMSDAFAATKSATGRSGTRPADQRARPRWRQDPRPAGRNGLREVALGIESGGIRMLE